MEPPGGGRSGQTLSPDDLKFLDQTVPEYEGNKLPFCLSC